MLLAVVSDVHGNWPALEAALAEIRSLGCEKLVFLGDAVGYFPDGLACARLIGETFDHVLMGNHEAMLLGRRPLDRVKDADYGLDALKPALSPEDRRRLAGGPESLELDLDGRKILFVHGAPDAPLEGYVYPDTPLKPGWGEGYDAVFMGHTHRPFIRESGGTLFVNAGSCGLPRDGEARASFAIFDSAALEATLVRMPLAVAQLWRRYPEVPERVRQKLEPQTS
jgi:predicted phosphodiesterase